VLKIVYFVLIITRCKYLSGLKIQNEKFGIKLLFGNLAFNNADFFLDKRNFIACISIFILIITGLFFTKSASSQESNPDSTFSERLKPVIDTLVRSVSDTLGFENPEDSLIVLDKPSFLLETQIDYKAAEEIHFDVVGRKVYLHKNAEIVYGNISLKADYIEIDFNTNQAYAKGVPDSTGKVVGNPVFTESGTEFESEIIKYNFDTKKGFIRKVITQDGEGYLHGDKIKRMPDGRINVKDGKYTTCNLEHPHFMFRYSKAQMIPDNKIVSGPAWLVIEDVPVPLAVPFGLFPNQSGQRSGIIVPSFGESANRGFFLEGGGYYWGISDYMDLTVTGDIFTSGSWSVRPMFRYAKRYRYNGNLNFSYAKNILGDKDDPNVTKSTDYSIRWTHSQDPKARPNSRFSANVNIVTQQYNDFNLTNTEAYLSNTFQSSVSYQTNFNNNLFLSLNATHQQNTIDGSVNMTLPTLTFNTKQFYPFRRQNPVGRPRWYENINLKYTMNANNQIATHDSLLFEPGWMDDFRFGVKNNIPVSFSINLLKFFNLTNSFNYSEKWYPWTIRKDWVNDTLFSGNDTIIGYVETDTVRSFKAARQFSYTAGISTRVYGMYQFKKGPVTAIRHVLTPSVSFTYRPDFGSEFWGYWQDVQYNSEGDIQRYSIFQGTLYGGPPDGKSGTVSFSLNNNLEMKVRSRKDTITGTKKVKLIDNFSIATSYDVARDSLNWNPLVLSGRTTLFKKLNITYSSIWNPYAVDSLGRVIDKFEWEVSKKLFRMQNTTWNFGFSFRLSQSDFKKGREKEEALKDEEAPEFLDQYPEQEVRDVLDNPNAYIDWNNPWSITFTYNLRFSNTPRYINYETGDVRSTVQTLGVIGDVNITPKWKLQFRTGYDFETRDFTYTSIDVYRDLHCWEMFFSWIPTGTRKSWNFGINVKASILQDMKYSRKKDFRDSYR